MAGRPDPGWDAELEAAASVRSRVRAALDAEPVPRDDIDAAILAAARRAVGSGPGQPKRGVFAAWRAPLAAAAVLVIAASLTLLFHPEDERPAEPAPAAPPPAVIAQDAAVAPQVAAPRAVEARAEKDSVTLQEAPRQPAAGLALGRSRERSEAKMAGASPLSADGRDASPVGSASPPPAAPAAEPVQSAETATEEATAALPAEPGPVRKAEAGGESERRADELRRNDLREALRPTPPEAPPRAAAFPAEAQRLAKARKADAAAGSASAVPADPALEAIVSLWRAGRRDEALEALRRWRCEHPQAVLPSGFAVPPSSVPACEPPPAQEPPREDR